MRTVKGTVILTAIVMCCTSASWALEENIYHFDGTSWGPSLGTIEAGSPLVGLGNGAGLLYNYGDGQTYHFNGTSWGSSLGAFEYPQLTGLGNGTGLLYDYVDNQTYHFNGTSWSSPLGAFGNAQIAGLGNGTALLQNNHYGQPGQTYHFNGTSWGSSLGAFISYSQFAGLGNGTGLLQDYHYEQPSQTYLFNGTSWSGPLGAFDVRSGLISLGNGTALLHEYHSDQISFFNGTSWSSSGPFGTSSDQGIYSDASSDFGNIAVVTYLRIAGLGNGTALCYDAYDGQIYLFNGTSWSGPLDYGSFGWDVNIVGLGDGTALFHGSSETYLFDGTSLSGPLGAFRAGSSIVGFGDGTALLLPSPFPIGDANHDGVVSAGDYAAIQAHFGDTGEPGILGDANQDGVVSAGDYAAVMTCFPGNIAYPLTAAPEPATLSLLVIGGATLLHRRRLG